MPARFIDETTRGVYFVSPTPFADDGRIDFDSVDRLVDFCIECGVDGLSILGLAGEAPALSNEECVAYAERVLRRINGRIPVVVNVSVPRNLVLQRLAAEVMGLGAAGVMLCHTPALRTDEQIGNYIADVLKLIGSQVPVVLLAAPRSAPVPMSVELINELFKQFPALKVLKHEDSPSLRKLTRLRALERTGERRRISIMVGSAMFLPLELRRGADGAMTSSGYPEMLAGVCAKFFAGDVDGAEDLHDAFLPLLRFENQPGVGLAIRKEILRRRGVIGSARSRAVRARLEADDLKDLDRLIARLDRKLAGLALRLAVSQRPAA